MTDQFLWLSTQHCKVSNQRETVYRIREFKNCFQEIGHTVLQINLLDCVIFIYVLIQPIDIMWHIFYSFIFMYQPIGLVSRVFTYGLRNWGSIPGRVIPKTQKIVFDTVKSSLADNMRQGKKNSHCAVKKWCTGREWPVNCMTVISARWQSHMPFQR